MKTMIRFFAVVVSVLGFVVGASAQQIKVPGSLPIGTGFPGDNVRIIMSIMYEDPTYSADGFGTNVMYSSDMGTLEDAVRHELIKLVEQFVPVPGTERINHTIDVFIYRFIEEMSFGGSNDYGGGTGQYPIGGSYGLDNKYQLVEVDGKWIFPKDAVERVKISYQSYVGTYAKGLVEVQLTRADEFGNEYYTDVSANGITDKTCSEYPGGAAYDGPDILKIPIGFAYASLYKEHPDYTLPRGYYYLTFGEAKATWAKYDLQTGLKIGSNEPVQMPFTLAISLVQLDETGKIALLSRKPIRWGLKLSVTGPLKPATLEYADRIVGGQWTILTKLDLVYDRVRKVGSGEFVEPMPTTHTRFYRVR